MADRPAGEAPFGTFSIGVDREFVGSPGLLRILGFTPGEVVPGEALVAAHVHPDDRTTWQAALGRSLAEGHHVVLVHRLISAGAQERTATTTLTPRFSDGRVVAVEGVLTDLTDPYRAATAATVTEAVERATATRGPIDQAKGILMAVLELDDEQAFDLLRWHSSHTNVKLRDVCARVIGGMSGADARPPRQRLATVFDELGAAPPVRGKGWTATGAGSARREDLAAPGGLLPPALLPRILTRAVEDASVCITVSDIRAQDQPLVYVNAAFERLTGYPAAEILGRNCRFLQRDDRDEVQTAALHEAIGKGRVVDALIRNYRADGSMFWNEFHLSPVRSPRGRVTHYVGYQLDVTERIERDQQLERLAYHDAATGLPNRTGALRGIDEMLSGKEPLDVVAVCSGQFGDGDVLDGSPARLVTMLAAQRLQALFPHATLARWETEALLLIGTGISEQTVRAEFDRPASTPDGRITIRVDVGAAECPRDGLTAPNLVRQALQRARQQAPAR